MIGLPQDPRQSEIKAFWIAINLATAIILPWLLAFTLGLSGLLYAAVLIPIFIIGLVFSGLPRGVYKIWNWVIIRISWRLNTLCLAICYFLLSCYGKLLNSQFKDSLTPVPGQSSWHEKESSDPRDYFATWIGTSSHSTGRWLKELFQWSRSSGNYWTIALIPYLVLLHLLRLADRKGNYANIYTLF